MTVRFHLHAVQRMRERGTTRAEVVNVIGTGRSSVARFGRRRFRKVFPFNSSWNRKRYAHKQVDAFAVRISDGWFVITVVVRYF